MNFSERKFLAAARVTFATRLDEVRLIDGGIRIARRQDFVIAVATRAVRCHRRIVLRREAVVTLEECLHAIRRQIVFRVDALGGMAAAAHIFGNLQRLFAPVERTDLMLIMTPRADGRIVRPRRHRLAVNALLPFLLLPCVTRSASGRLAGEIHRRGRRLFRNDLM